MSDNTRWTVAWIVYFWAVVSLVIVLAGAGS